VLSSVAVGAAADLWTGKKVSVLGDSYSAYQGAPGSIHCGYPNAYVTQQGQMWWAQVIDGLDGQLEKDRACTGSAVYTTYGVCPSMWYMASTNGPVERCGLGNPDVILVMGGLNDFWVFDLSGSSRGVDAFRSGVMTLFGRLESEYPQAEKIVVIGKIHSWQSYRWGLAATYRNVLRSEARKRKFLIVDLDGYLGTEDGDYYSETYPHPTLQGMNKIAQRVIDVVRHGEGDCQRTFDCLEMDGEGYMMSDYVPNLATTKIRVKFRERDGSGVTNVLFSASGYNQGTETRGNVFSLMSRKGGYRYENQAEGAANVGPGIGVVPEEGDGVIDVTTAGNSLKMGEYELRGGAAATNVLASGSLVFGAVRNASNGVYVGMSPKTIYGVEIWEGSKLVRDYVPALDLDGRATLYDRVNDDSLSVYGGHFVAYDYPGSYVNPAQCRSYDDLFEAYQSAGAGECVVMRASPAQETVITGRVDVALKTQGYDNVEVVSPSIWYNVVKDGDTYRLVKSRGLRPQFACSSVRDLFTPVGGKLKIRLDNVLAGATYAVYTANAVTGPWTLVASGFERSEFEVDAPPKDANSFFIKAEMSGVEE